MTKLAPYTVVGFYTQEYADCVRAFGEQAARLGLPCELETMQSLRDWASNTGMKPTALFRLRERLRGPLLYLDIDTILLKAPALPIGTWDIALSENPVPTHVNRVAAQCFFVGDTIGAKTFLSEWAQRCRNTGGQDHRQLTNTVMANRAAILGRADFTGCFHINGLRTDRTQALS